MSAKGAGLPTKEKSSQTKGDSSPANDNSSLVKGASLATGAVLPAQSMPAFPEEANPEGDESFTTGMMFFFVF